MTATFNEAVQSGTISFTLDPQWGHSRLAATVAYNSSTNTATLTPSAALAYSTTYTATVSGAKDTAGDPMSAVRSRGRSPRTPPRRMSPARRRQAGPRVSAVSTAATATFNEAVQAGTITFTLVNSSAALPSPPAVAYNSSNNTVTLTPSSALAYNTKYTATVSGAKDSAGDPMSGSVLMVVYNGRGRADGDQRVTSQRGTTSPYRRP